MKTPHVDVAIDTPNGQVGALPNRFKRYPAYNDSGVDWLGQIPAHWDVTRSKRLFRLRNTRALPSDRQLTASQQHGVIPQDDFMAREGRRVVQVITGADILKHVEPSDFVISMRSFQGGIEFSPYAGAISSAYVVLAPSRHVEPSYFLHLLKSRRYIQALQCTSNLVRDGQALRFENFALVDLPFVPRSEQRMIAAFLDRETARIDALVAKKDRLIELLQEKRTALITHAVTKGLDLSVPMKDSGVEWLGEVPTHWNVKRIRDVARSLQTGPFGSQLHADEYVVGQWPVINPANLRDSQLIPDRECTVTETVAIRLERHRLASGDILFARRGEMGRCGLATHDETGWLCGTGCIRLRTRVELVKPAFLLQILSTARVRDWLQLQSVGSTMDNLNTSIIGRIPVALPTVGEQASIVEFINHETPKIDQLITRVQAAIEHLDELRTTIISAAVTGKIDVRGEVARRRLTVGEQPSFG
jgi:type I restriction enzyme S subunit